MFPIQFRRNWKRSNYINYNIKIRLAKISFFSCIYKDAYTNLYSFVPFQIARERISSSKSPNFPLLLLRPSLDQPLFNEHRSVTRFCIHSCIMSKGWPPRSGVPPPGSHPCFAFVDSRCCWPPNPCQGLISIFAGVSVIPSCVHRLPTMTRRRGWRHAGSTIDDIGPDRCNIPRGKIFERRGKGGGRVAVAEEEEEVKGCLMCQLIARKLERIALNDRADVVEGLKEGLRGEIGRFSSFFFFFFFQGWNLF